MKKDTALKIVKELPFDTKRTVYKDRITEIYILRPSKLSRPFKAYNPKKNFQIWLKENGTEFRPNHLRILIDLNLRAKSRPDLKKQLLLAFDNIFYGEDPEEELSQLARDKFEHQLNNIMVIGYLAQFLHIEQEYAYNKVSKFDPPNLFLQGWIRMFIDDPKKLGKSSKSIDILTMSVANGQPPHKFYVDKENKKSKNYVKNLKPLWYLNKSD